MTCLQEFENAVMEQLPELGTSQHLLLRAGFCLLQFETEVA